MDYWLQLADQFAKDHQALVSLASTLFVILYTVITAWMLRVTVRQAKEAVRPVLTLDAVSLEQRRTDGQRLRIANGGLMFKNTGSGAAHNIHIRVWTH